jgi:hypothetical protein
MPLALSIYDNFLEKNLKEILEEKREKKIPKKS